MKSHILQTNFNNKMACECFIHIDLAPSAGIPESVASVTPIMVKTADGSHEPVLVRLLDLCRLSLSEVHSGITWPSHGMEWNEFQLWMTQQRESVRSDTPLAVYFYRKVHDTVTS